MTPRRRRNLRIELWTDEEEHEVIRRGARRARMTVSAYLRALALREDERANVPTLSPQGFTDPQATRTG